MISDRTWAIQKTLLSHKCMVKLFNYSVGPSRNTSSIITYAICLDQGNPLWHKVHSVHLKTFNVLYFTQHMKMCSYMQYELWLNFKYIERKFYSVSTVNKLSPSWSISFDSNMFSSRPCGNLRFHGSLTYILITDPHTTPAEQSSPQFGWHRPPKISWDSVASPKTDATISAQYNVTRLTASSLGRGYVCQCHVFLSLLCCRVSEWRHLLQQRHRGLAEGLNHSHGNVRHWECADKHKHSPYRKAQT